MENCIFCGTKTSFIFEGDGEYHERTICPKCQKEKFKTRFHTGCAEDDCSVKIKRE